MTFKYRKKFLHLTVLISWVASIIISPLGALAHTTDTEQYPASVTARPNQQSASVDFDFDGLSDDVETAGWSNQSGGPYFTDPNLADSDLDGLTDGEEHLFETDPLDDKSPGIYALYRDEYQTKKFYPWRQYGNKFIVHSNISPGKERDIIARRGTTVYIGGPSGATLDIDESQGSLTDLTPIKNSCGGGWAIPIPADSTVGTYTLELSEGSWDRELTLHVVFELDAPEGELTQQDIDVFAYNDDLNNEKDLLTIYWDTSYDYNYKDDTGWQLNKHNVYGWGIGFETDYNQQYVFEDYMMPSIQGIDDKYSATSKILRLTHKDSGMEFNPNSFPNSTKNALTNSRFDVPVVISYTDEFSNTITEVIYDGFIDADCNTHAGVFTSFLKGAGLTSRPVAVDWKERHYDTATEIWLNGEWKVARGYSTEDGITTRQWWGSRRYKSVNDLILVSGSDWEWDLINVKYRGTEEEDYKTARDNSNNIYPHYPKNTSPSSVTSEVLKWDWVQMPVDEYWPGTQPATVIGDCSGSGNNKGCESGRIGLPYSAPTEGTPFVTHSEKAHFGQVVSDYGVDRDEDGDYEILVVEVEITVNEAGYYTVEALLDDLDPETRLGYQVDGVDWLQEYQYFEAGTHVIPLNFNGYTIREKGAPGPYILAELILTDLERPVPGSIDDEHLIDLQLPQYVLSAYDLEDFDDQGADLSGEYTHQIADANGDGYFDGLVIETTIDMADVDVYSVQADLTNYNGEVVSTATWSGDSGQVSLQFDATLGSVKPYYLRNVELYNSKGQLIDSQGEGSAQFQFDHYAYTTGSLYVTGIQSLSNDFSVASVSPVDSDNDGDYDRLDFLVNATIVSDGAYSLEGWLESSTGALIALRNNETTLTAGSQQVPLSFDGQSINSFRANGPYKLVALKLKNLSGQVLVEQDIAFETDAYTFDQFDGVNSDALMYDGMEGADQSQYWNLAETQWNVTQEAFYTPSRSWTDSPESKYQANTTTWLTSNPINVANGEQALPVLSFQSCQAIADDFGKVQVRTNGTNAWTDVTDYTGASDGWNFEEVFFTDALNATSIEFRFELSTNASNQDNGWFIDDVTVGLNTDPDNDGISNEDEGAGTNQNSDDDELPDYLDDDSDNDGIGDSDEGNVDTDEDGIPDFRDEDADNDGIGDSDEGNSDTDDDGIPDFKDTDSDNDGIDDTDEGNNDTDGDGTPDFKDTDADNDGIGDKEEGTGDIDGDGILDYLDNDSDNDTIPDNIENNHPPGDGDGIPNTGDNDSDDDNIIDEHEWTESGNHEYCTNDGGLDTDTDAIPNCRDNDIDGDGIPNFLDPDSDGDGMDDADEVGPLDGPTDSDGDGIPNVYDSENDLFSDHPVGYISFLPLLKN